MTATKIIESRAVVLEGKGLDRVIRVITPGMGSSGYYPSETLEAAVKESIFDTGLHLYVDHPSQSEAQDRPERSVRDLAAVATGPAVWNANEQAIDQPIKIFEHFSWLGDKNLAEAIGMSIRASAEVSEKSIDGVTTRVIDKLTEAHSVDFVTRAGRGGKILEAMESARVNIGEALQSDLRERLDDAVAEKYNSDRVTAWVRDWDADENYAIVSLYSRNDDGRKLIKEGYSVIDSGVSLAGDAIEVKIVTNYVAVAQTATEAEGAPIVEITEAEHQALIERVEAAERRATEAETRENEAKATRNRKDAAEARVVDKIGNRLDHLPNVLRDRAAVEALREIPATESGALDEAALDQRIEAAVEAELAVARAFGSVTSINGHGHTAPVGADASEASSTARKRIPFNRPAGLKG